MPPDSRVPAHGKVGHTWLHPDRVLIEMILRGFDPGNLTSGSPVFRRSMPSMRRTLTPDEAATIIAYMKTSWSDFQHASRAHAFGCERYATPSC
jgi:hypothetical protein